MEIFNPVEQSKLRRKEAIDWWITLRSQKKVILANEYYPGRKHFMLKGHEIEAMWVFETNYQYTS